MLYKFRDTKRRFVLVFFLCMSTIGFTQHMDAENIGEAAAMAELTFRNVANLRETCSRLLPSDEQAIQFLTLHWLDQNRNEEQAIISFSNAANDKWKAEREKYLTLDAAAKARLPEAERKRQCQFFFGQILNRNQDIEKMTPAVSRFLRQYLSEHPLSNIDNERYVFIFGCMKKNANQAQESKQRFLFTASKTACSCVWNVRQTNTTQEERNLESAEFSGQGTIANLPHVKRLAPLYASCIRDNIN